MQLSMLIVLFLIFKCTLAWSNPTDITCPSLAEIKNGNFNSWLPLYKEGEELASAIDIKKIQEHIMQFSGAKWDTSYLEAAHCFYSGDDSITDKIIFARDAWRPLHTISWHWISNKKAECDSALTGDCGFAA